MYRLATTCAALYWRELAGLAATIVTRAHAACNGILEICNTSWVSDHLAQLRSKSNAETCPSVSVRAEGMSGGYFMITGGLREN